MSAESETLAETTLQNIVRRFKAKERGAASLFEKSATDVASNFAKSARSPARGESLMNLRLSSETSQ